MERCIELNSKIYDLAMELKGAVNLKKGEPIAEMLTSAK